MEALLRIALSRTVRRGRLHVHTAQGSRLEFGDSTGELVVVRFHDSSAQWAFLRDPDMQLGELYVDGRITIEAGTIYDFVFLLLQDSKSQSTPFLPRALDRMRFATRRLRQRNEARRAKYNVAHHYDLDTNLYRLFLDADLQYSCAYFEEPGQDLEEAQLAKKRHIAAKLLVEPGHKVLDIGCGWGGLAFYLSQIAGAGEVLGITLSEEQIAVARGHHNKHYPSGRITFSLEDYRAVTGTFDRIVSVGMFEHVGLGFYETYFKTCQRLLDSRGVMLLHTIGCSDIPGFVTPWLDKYIFPGGYIPSLSEIVPAAERAGFIISDIEIQQLHYAWTLHAWRERFLAQRDKARVLYDERFCRMWEFYLAAAEVAFRCEDLVVFQIQLTKLPAVTPPTRDYIDRRKAALKVNELEMASTCKAGTPVL